MSMSSGGPPNPTGSTLSFGNPGALAGGRNQFNQSFASSGSATSSDMGDFTAQMRDRQARGKDPYRVGDSSDDGNLDDDQSGTGPRLRLGTGRVEKEDFSVVERRQKAIAFLDNPELLMMHHGVMDSYLDDGGLDDGDQPANRGIFWAAIDWSDEHIEFLIGPVLVYGTRNSLVLALANLPFRLWKLVSGHTERSWDFALNHTPDWFEGLTIIVPGVTCLFLMASFILAPFLFVAFAFIVALFCAWVPFLAVLKSSAIVRYMIDYATAIYYHWEPTFRLPGWQRRMGMPWELHLPFDVVILLGVRAGKRRKDMFWPDGPDVVVVGK
ncbi:hypothetical protein BT67DRAFT_435232 [Trichocladium antarcticum]|uniref:Uncharacterized protein n=1 Tax=Trichocladium antarcticum TaxID=1450529 RepID=A0AAN6ZC89_9PEZI|nr:hypothetical protein BT67DRAFT_435232 [Trichocladium antarcticum]